MLKLSAIRVVGQGWHIRGCRYKCTAILGWLLSVKLTTAPSRPQKVRVVCGMTAEVLPFFSGNNIVLHNRESQNACAETAGIFSPRSILTYCVVHPPGQDTRIHFFLHWSMRENVGKCVVSAENQSGSIDCVLHYYSEFSVLAGCRRLGGSSFKQKGWFGGDFWMQIVAPGAIKVQPWISWLCCGTKKVVIWFEPCNKWCVLRLFG